MNNYMKQSRHAHRAQVVYEQRYEKVIRFLQNKKTIIFRIHDEVSIEQHPSEPGMAKKIMAMLEGRE